MIKDETENRERKVERVLPDMAWLSKLYRQGIWGILLLALAIVTLIGLLSRTEGSLLDPWSELIQRIFGWGSYVVVLTVAGLSVLMAISKLPRLTAASWRVVVGIEVTFLLLLGLLHLLFFRSDPWTAAQSGLGGGYIGAVCSGLLSELIGPWPTGLILVVALLLSTLLIVGMTPQEGLEWLEDQAVALKEWIAMALMRLSPETARPTAGPPIEVQETATRLETGSGQVVATTAAAAPAVAAPKPRRRYKIALPALTLLDEPSSVEFSKEDADRKARIIQETLAHFDVPATVVETNWGPRVTQFGIEPGYISRRGQDGEETERKTRVSKIASLSNDLALALAASPIRIEAPVPGRSIVGIEVPNDQLSVVSLRQVMESRTFRRNKSELTLALGSGVAGHAVTADLVKMPHLLIAGATGAGKSACINAIVIALLFQNSPLTLRLVMIDPKRVELTRYNGIPHLYGNVEVDTERIVGVLKWLVNEMQERYKKLAKIGARHIADFNSKWQPGSGEYMPRIVVLVDELADMMFFAPDEVEKNICRLAQMARAVGIHLVLATQRPSVDVVTGLIKANFPARIAFSVTTGTDSRVILDGVGAETLLGKGDMLFMSPDASKLKRIQGSYVTDEESSRIAEYWKTWAVEQEWETAPPPWDVLLTEEENRGDELLTQAIEIVRQQGTASASLLQRRMRIGYPRAASLIDEMEALDVIGPAEGGRRQRKVINVESHADFESDAGAITAIGGQKI